MMIAEEVNDRDKVEGARSRVLWILVAAGWLPLTYFAIRTSMIGNINGNVRAFQMAYVIGFAGYAALAAVLLRVKDILRMGSWKWWLIGCILLRLPLLATEPRDDAYRYV